MAKGEPAADAPEDPDVPSSPAAGEAVTSAPASEDPASSAPPPAPEAPPKAEAGEAPPPGPKEGEEETPSATGTEGTDLEASHTHVPPAA